MERDDFSRMAAPIYAKGFIRLYAEYLGLDPVRWSANTWTCTRRRSGRPDAEEAAQPGEDAPERKRSAIDWASWSRC